MRELSLFSGGGGGLLASKLLGWKTLGYVEVNDYCQRVLAQRIEDGALDYAPIFSDIKTFIDEGYAKAYKGMVDVVSGGFPCQKFSNAARGRTVSKNMWPWMAKVVATVQPKLVFSENVNRRAINIAACSLRALGYKVNAITLSAKDCGADHVRKRFWLCAYSDDQSELFSPIDAKMVELPEFCSGIWNTYPDKSRVAHGVASRVDRLKAIGNGQVPLVAATAWRILSKGLTLG